MFGISENQSQNKNQHPQDLGLKFEKTNIEIRINIFEILCVYVRVCQFSGKTNSFDFFSPNLPKNGFRVGNSRNYCRNKNQHPRYTMCANFQSKWKTFNFSAQICPKQDLGLETEKSNFRIRITLSRHSVCQFSAKLDKFDFFGPNLSINGYRVGNSEN